MVARGAREWGLDAGCLLAVAKWTDPGATGRMGYKAHQDLFGRASDLARAHLLQDACLAKDGHRVRREKCSIWKSHGPPRVAFGRAMDLPEFADGYR